MKRTHRSPLTGGVLVAIGLLALAGWTGGRAPATGAFAEIASVVSNGDEVPRTTLGVRDRDAWRPSPIAGITDNRPQPAAPQTGAGAAPAPIGPPGPPAPIGPPGPAVPVGPPGAPGQLVQPVRPGQPNQLNQPNQPSQPGQLAQPIQPGQAARAGEWREIRFFSRILGREVPYLAWLPPDYGTSERTYPVLYLLHGAGDGFNAGHMEWRGFGLDAALADLLARREIEPMIVILPEGQQGYWINHANGGPRWADYVAQDVVRHVDVTFRTDTRPERRAVGGLSMGGHGALQLALNHPGVFRIAGAHSPSLRRYEQSPEFFGSPEWFARFDPLMLAMRGAGTSGLKVWIDSGSRDRWRKDNEELAKALESKGARVDLHVLDGGHDGDYWRANIRRYLRFYSDTLAGK